jgi:hypothetical protein
VTLLLLATAITVRIVGGAVDGYERTPALAACHDLWGDAFIECSTAATVPRTCDGCTTALPKIDIRALPSPDRHGREVLEVTIDNPTPDRIYFAAFAGKYPYYDIERQRDGEWVAKPWDGCGRLFDDLGEGSLGPGERRTFQLDQRARDRPIRIGFGFWFGSGDRWVVWSDPYTALAAPDAPCDASGRTR